LPVPAAPVDEPVPAAPDVPAVPAPVPAEPEVPAAPVTASFPVPQPLLATAAVNSTASEDITAPVLKLKSFIFSPSFGPQK
jgi:hypothetical protein